MFEALIPRFPDYELIDSGDFEKLERFGRYVVRRPEPQAIWRRSLTEEEWRRLADASFLRDGRSEERGEWRLRSGMPSRWTVDYAYEGMRLRMRLGLTSFKHVGLFPEQAANWNFIYDNCVRMRAEERTPKVLNLFAYTGGATLAARAAGADTTHVDSVKQVVTWARENMEQSGLEKCAGSSKTRSNSCSAKCGEVTATTELSSIPRLTDGVPTAKSGFWRITSARCSNVAPGCWSRAERFWC